jgi:uncharacterized membrane protein
MNATMVKIARTLYAIPLIVFGLFHFTKGKDMAGFVLPGWPAATVFVYIAGLGLILAGVSFIINKYVRISGILLALELLIFILAIHIPGLMHEATMQMSLTSLLKDFGLMSAALYIAFSANSEETELK